MFDISLFSQYVRISLNWFLGITLGFMLLLSITGNTKKFICTLFGDMEDAEITKFSILSLCFGVIIGVYWMMRTLKEAVFLELVGASYLPVVKLMAPVVLAFVLFAYSKIVDRFQKHQLFWVVCSCYGLIFVAAGLLWSLNIPEMTNPLVSWIPGRFVGWLYFAAVESFGGIVVGAVFWAFVASTTTSVSAKKGYPLIFAGAQIGNFIGPAINAGYAITFGNQAMILIAAALLFLIPIIMQVYMAVIPSHLHISDDTGHAKPKTGALEGLRLIATQPFLIGVLVVSTAYEIVATIIDMQFKIITSTQYSKAHYTVFMSLYAMCAALVALTFALVGIRLMIKNVGISKSLLAYPVIMGVTVLAVWSAPSAYLLGSLFTAMIAVKAFNYSLNAPIKELLYLPTSKDVKYKAKGFIDGLGVKIAKSAGAGVTLTFVSNLPNLLRFGSIISLGVVGAWGAVAMFTGRKYDHLIEKKEIIE